MITPETLAASGTEQGAQSALFCWAQQSGIPELEWMFAIPNGGLRSKQEGAKLKAAGVKAGVWDIFLPVPCGQWHGLFIEMKVGKNYLSEKQIQFGATMYGKYTLAVCWSWEEARDCILEYLEMTA